MTQGKPKWDYSVIFDAIQESGTDNVKDWLKQLMVIMNAKFSCIILL